MKRVPPNSASFSGTIISPFEFVSRLEDVFEVVESGDEVEEVAISSEGPVEAFAGFSLEFDLVTFFGLAVGDLGARDCALDPEDEEVRSREPLFEAEGVDKNLL